MEYCVPVFNGGLTFKHVENLERIQKRVCKIILGPDYTDYESALRICKLEKLETRRRNLCVAFAQSLLDNSQCKELLPKKKNISISLRHIPNFTQIKCKTVRFRKSAIPYFIDLLNAT